MTRRTTISEDVKKALQDKTPEEIRAVMEEALANPSPELRDAMGRTSDALKRLVEEQQKKP